MHCVLTPIRKWTVPRSSVPQRLSAGSSPLPSLLLFLLVVSLLTGGRMSEAQEDQSSLDIHNDVIYGGDQEAHQFDYRGGSELFSDEHQAQSQERQEEERQQMAAADEKLFQDEAAQAVTAEEPGKESNLFAEGYQAPEIMVKEQEADSDWTAFVFWLFVSLGGAGLLATGWLLGRRFSKVFTVGKEWL